MVTSDILKLIREWADKRRIEVETHPSRSGMTLASDWVGKVPVYKFAPFTIWGQRDDRNDDTVDILIFNDVTQDQLEAVYAYVRLGTKVRPERIVLRVLS